MKTHHLITTVVLFIAFTAHVCLSQNHENIFFKGTYDNFVRNVKKQNKRALLFFRTEQCSPCEKLENETFTDPELVKYLNSGFVVAKIDLSTNDGKLLAEKYDIDEFPAMMVIDHGIKAPHQLKGFYSPEHLKKELEKAKEQIFLSAYP